MPHADANRSRTNGPGALLAASVLAAVMGSVHAFSVFLEPLEGRFDQSRGMVSLTYSLALVTLTLAVLWGHRWYGRWPVGRFVTGICLVAALGVAIAAFAPTLWLVWLGYSLIFGCANGFGYGFGLQVAAQANPGREGLAMGCVTAAYALGAVISPALFAAAITAGGFPAAMLGLCVALVVTAPAAGGMLHLSRATYRKSESGHMPGHVTPTTMLLLWLGYGAGVAAGLMTIGHAAGIGTALGYDGPAWVAPVTLAICNLAGSLFAGQMADRIAPMRILIGLPLVSAIAISLLALVAAGEQALYLLGLVGFAYGGTIAVYPAAIAKQFGAVDGPALYGRVFTAWGAAGLAGPWLAGHLYDLGGTYQLALLIAGGLSFTSTLSASVLMQRQAN